MTSDEKLVTPDVVIKLTGEQMKNIQPLKEKQNNLHRGMIFGSVGVQNEGDTIALSYISQELAEKIRDLAYEELGENNNGNS